MPVMMSTAGYRFEFHEYVADDADPPGPSGLVYGRWYPEKFGRGPDLKPRKERDSTKTKSLGK